MSGVSRTGAGLLGYGVGLVGLGGYQPGVYVPLKALSKLGA